MDIYDIMVEMEKQIEAAATDVAKARQGNKAAARRLRKFTSNMGSNLGKEFRRESIKAEKQGGQNA